MSGPRPKRRGLACGAFLLTLLPGLGAQEPQGTGAGEDPAPASRPAVRGREAPLTPGEEKLVAVALKDLAGEAAAAREAAIETLAPLAAVVPERIAALLRHEQAGVRLATLQVFRRNPPEEAGAWVKPLLRDQSPQVREQALLIVAMLKPHGWLDDLCVVLWREREPRVVRQALNTLGQGGDAAAVEPLLDFLERNTDPYLGRKALQAVRSLSGEDLGEDLAAWRSYWNKRRELERRKAEARERARTGR